MDDKTPTDATTPQADLGISFAGGGWLMCYLFGVAKALRHHHIHHTTRFTGTSAGALTAIGLTLDADFDAIAHTVITTYVPQAHSSFAGPFQMRRYLVDALTRHANLDNFERCNADPRKCTVVYTSLSTLQPRRKSTFSSASHLLSTLIASCCATPLVGLPFQFEGEWVIDGGLVENQPRFQSYHSVKRVVNVSPNILDADADIRPSQYVPPWWSMFPPSATELAWVFALGENDGHDWCVRNGFCQPSPISTTPVRPRVQQTALGQFVGYQWIDQLLLSLLNCFGVSWDISSAVKLFDVEFLMWKMFQVTRTAATTDGALLMWVFIVASVILGFPSALLGFFCLATSALFIAYSMARAFLRVHQSNEWSQIDQSLRALRGLTGSDDLVTQTHSTHRLTKDHHATLSTHLLVYRITHAHVQQKTQLSSHSQSTRFDLKR